MRFSIAYDTQAVRFLRNAERDIARRIVERIEALLTENPVPHDAKRIQGARQVFRIRVGKHRVLYRTDYDTHTIIVIKIDRREHAYG